MELPDAPDGAQATSGGQSGNTQSGGTTRAARNQAAARALIQAVQNTTKHPRRKPRFPLTPMEIRFRWSAFSRSAFSDLCRTSGRCREASKPHPPGWKYNFTVATHQATDYSTFIFLGLTSLTAEGIDEHPALGKGVDGFYAYTWRGFLDKTDGTYLAAWLLPSLIHEDTRFYALGQGHSILMRELYVISREGVARTYGGHQTPNIAGLGGKVLTQVVSRNYYPTSATTFPVLAEKFGYSVMRDVIFQSIREFYPDAAAHFIREHRKKMAAKAAARDAAQ